MDMTVSQMTVDELRDLIGAVVEEKLAKFVRESELDINDDLAARLAAQRKRVENGDRGIAMEDVLEDIGLN